LGDFVSETLLIVHEKYLIGLKRFCNENKYIDY
jgi:hypothetical protein